MKKQMLFNLQFIESDLVEWEWEEHVPGPCRVDLWRSFNAQNTLKTTFQKLAIDKLSDFSSGVLDGFGRGGARCFGLGAFAVATFLRLTACDASTFTNTVTDLKKTDFEIKKFVMTASGRRTRFLALFGRLGVHAAFQ